MPPFLQQLKGYPVLTTGVVMAPRGAGMMVAMMLTARLIGRFDARLLVLVGLLLCAFSLWDMTTFTLDVSESHIIWNGVWLGFGLGLVFPPLTTLTFATLPARLRTEGAAINALLRNLGASVGIAVLVSLLAQQPGEPCRARQPVHAVQRRLAVRQGDARCEGPTMLAVWDAEINRQAAMIGYLNDFRAMTICVLVTIRCCSSCASRC